MGIWGMKKKSQIVVLCRCLSLSQPTHLRAMGLCFQIALIFGATSQAEADYVGHWWSLVRLHATVSVGFLQR